MNNIKIFLTSIIIISFLGCGLEKMASDYNKVVYEQTPTTPEVHGGQLSVNLKGIFPEKYFAKKATVEIIPVIIDENGGESKLKSITLQGEQASGGDATIFFESRPLLSFAKENKIHFVATNIPRRFASMVYRFGIDTLEYLPPSSKQFMAPIPIDYDTSLHCYKEISVMAEGHGGENLPKSQAIKDATMAYFVHKNMKENTRFLHYNGSYHSRFHESIMWYLLQLNPDLNIVTIEVVEQEDISQFDEELIGNADYFIVVDEDMCKTH